MSRKFAGTAKRAAVGLGAGAVVVAGPLTPAASAATLDINQDVYTTGPLMGLAAGLGLDSVTLPPIALGSLGEVVLTLDFNQVSEDPVTLYDTVNGLPFLRGSVPVTGATNSYNRYLGATPREFPATLGAGRGAYDLARAYRAEIQSVTSTNTDVPAGFTAWQTIAEKERQTLASGCVSLNPNNCPQVQPIYATNQALIFVRNPLRPNGGFDSRFGPLLNIFGVETTMPQAGVYQSDPVPSSAVSGNPKNPALRLNTATLDLTWAYDIESDLPVTLNPFAWTNSAFTAVPTNLLGGVELKGVDATAAGLNIAGVLGILNRESGGLVGISDGQGFYGTLLPNDLPILEPLRMPTRIFNRIFGTSAGTPLADALQPALTIAVNTGYTDVQTPPEGGLSTRTFDQAGEYVPLLSQKPLTGAEWVQVPGDLARALVVGFQDAFPVLRFGKTAPVLTVDGNHLAITHPPAAVTAAAATVPPAEVAADPKSAALAAAGDAPVEQPATPALTSRHARESARQATDTPTPKSRSGASREKRAGRR
ncbi:MAG: PE-PPE domain-containing protein [Mycobacterium sp.]|nr:PE-PPE domain-containing protein [Mycobacterium sp.]